MRDFGGDITVELAAEIKKIFTVIEFQLESGTEYYTDCDIGLFVPHEGGSSDISGNLVGHWPLNEGFGSDALDASGNGNDGTLINSPTWVPGIIGMCLDFEADSNQYVSLDDSLLTLDDDFTLSFWAVPEDDGTNTRWISLIDASDNFQVGIHANEAVFIRMDGTPNYTVASLISYGTEYHICVVRESGSFTLYINGVAYSMSSGGPVGDTVFSAIGGGISNYNCDGKIDEVRLYDTAATKLQVNEIFKREYTATDYKLKNMTHTLGMAVDSVTLTFPSAALGWGAQVGNYDIRGTAVIMSNVFLDDNNQVIVGPREMFRGFIDDWNLKQPDIDITFANAFIHWNKKVLRKPGPTCSWPFKFTECAYAGGETWCNHSYVRCVQLANTDNFGGSRFLPSLAAKKIWWGRASI